MPPRVEDSNSDRDPRGGPHPQHPVTGTGGFDGAKKVDGVKRHVLVDSGGVLVATVVTPADVREPSTPTRASSFPTKSPSY